MKKSKTTQIAGSQCARFSDPRGCGDAAWRLCLQMRGATDGGLGDDAAAAAGVLTVALKEGRGPGAGLPSTTADKEMSNEPLHILCRGYAQADRGSSAKRGNEGLHIGGTVWGGSNDIGTSGRSKID